MIVYEAMFPNGKRYIGITTKSLKERKVQHKHHSKYTKSKLYNAIRKYGWDNIRWKILEKCSSEEQMFEKERIFIKKYKTLDINYGYNLREGGQGGRHHKETKEKISIKNKGENNGMFGKTAWNKGKKLSQEHRDNLSKSHKGNVPWNKGKKLEPTGPLSEETKKKISKANSGERNGKSKLDWETVRKMREEYKTGQYTQRELAKKYNIAFGHMSQILNNKRWRE